MRALDIADCINETCPWSGKPVQAGSLTEYDGHVVGFCQSRLPRQVRKRSPLFRGGESIASYPMTHCAVGAGRLGTAFKLQLGGR